MSTAREKEHLIRAANRRMRMKRAQRAALGSINPRAGDVARVIPIIREIQKNGVTSLWKIADMLNAQGVRGMRGGKWYATTVRNLLDGT